MADQLSELNFKQDLAEALVAPESSRWILESPAPLELVASMRSIQHPSELFQARFLWVAYPGNEPPSLKFREAATGRLDDPTMWPRVRGFRPDSLDACVNWSFEGMVLHPEWVRDPRFRWDARGNPVLKVLRYLQDELDLHCSGRHG